jgi:hypothetical protein
MSIQPAVYAPASGAMVSAEVARRMPQGVSYWLQGLSKAGKSSLADSGPVPRIIFDVENSGFWTPSSKIYWDPERETVPSWPFDPRARSADGLWDTCIVLIQRHETLRQTLRVLNTGMHPFNSGSMDSVTFIQQRIMNELTRGEQMDQQQWGKLLRMVTADILAFKDLTTHPTNRLWSVCFVSGTEVDRNTRKWKPLLQGATAAYAPYVPDVLGWVDARGPGDHHMWIGPSPYHETGNRLWGRLPDDLQLGHPGYAPGWTIETMTAQVIEHS